MSRLDDSWEKLIIFFCDLMLNVGSLDCLICGGIA